MYKIEDIINKVHQSDCIEFMRKMPENSVDSLICDPPYGLEFMGKEWDKFKITKQTKSQVVKNLGAGMRRQTRDEIFEFQRWTRQWAKEALRVAKPGATLLSFGGTRTYHRMACAIEDAGWIIKDCIMWLYSTGFPKALDIKKSLDKKYSGGNMGAYEKETKQNTKYYLRLVREADLQKTISNKKAEGKVLQSGLSQQGISIKDQTKGGLQFSSGREKSSVEGWIDIQATKRELQRCKICALSERVFIDGEERWVCNGTPFGYGTAHWSPTPKNRSCPSYRPRPKQQQYKQSDVVSDKPSPQEIRKWNGWKSHGLKPAYEPIIVAQKPNDGTYANNALKWGVSGLNIDGGRIDYNGEQPNLGGRPQHTRGDGYGFKAQKDEAEANTKGRFPANIILDEEAAKILDEQSGESGSGKMKKGSYRHKAPNNLYQLGMAKKEGALQNAPDDYGDKGGASRFFYVAKASKKERNMGKMFYWEDGKEIDKELYFKLEKENEGSIEGEKHKISKGNIHPTCKPLKLMEYLCLLTKTPTGGVVLDPFMGSGTTGMACIKMGRDFIGIEKEEEYVKIAKARIEAVQKEKKQHLF